MIRRARVVLALVLAVLAAGAATTSASAAATSVSTGGAMPAKGPIVVIGTGGVRWPDVDADTPALYALIGNSTGWLAARSVRSVTCPADGWLAISAGRRAADLPQPKGRPICRQPTLNVTTAGAATTVPSWADYRTAATQADFDAEPGLLGDTLGKAGVDVAAIGPGAAIAAATTSGTVQHAWVGGAGTNGDVDGSELADDVQAALATDPQLLLVDIGEVRDPDQRGQNEPRPTGAYAQGRDTQVQAVDTRLGLVIGQLPADATVVVASLADAGAKGQLQLLAGGGPAPAGGSFTGSLIGSRSTRQNGLAQSTDLLPTILDHLGLPEPATAVGSTLRPVDTGGSATGRLQHLTDIDTAARAVTPIVPIFFNGLVIAQIVLYGAATLVLRRRGRAGDGPAAGRFRARTLTWLRRAAVVFAAVPAATYLANLLPWWRAGVPGLAVTGAVALFVVPIALLGLLGPWRDTLLGPMGAVGGATMLVLAADALTGSHLTLSSLMGVQPVVAGRFYGFGNVAFALFATGALVLAVALADALLRAGRRSAALGAVAAVGLVALVIDGTPGLGSDFGGPPAILPAFAVLGLLVAGVKVTWRRGLLIAGATVAVLVALGVVDWLRPAEDRTHLGRFVQTVIDGGALIVVRRKAGQNLSILFGSWLSLLLPFAVAFVTLVLARPVAWGVRPLALAYARSPVLRHGMAAFGVLLLLGFALNDSGTAIPAVAATVAIPLLIAASVRALQLADDERLESAVKHARRR